MNFSSALEYLKGSKKLRRRVWPLGRWVSLVRFPPDLPAPAFWAGPLEVDPGVRVKPLPYLLLRLETGESLPWTVDGLALLANDWQLLNDDD